MKKILCVFLASLSLFAFLPAVSADTAFWEDHYPYRTYTVDYQGELTYTQTAYIPLGNLSAPGALSAPQDLFLRDGLIYVADTGHARIAVFDYDGNLVSTIGDGILEQPTGVYVTSEGIVYVADKGACLVDKFDADGNFVRAYGRPSEPLFGTTSLYVPVKVAVGAGENIYVIGDGSTSGVIQLNYDGSFLGYYGVNLSSKSLIQKIAEIFVVGDEYASTTPASPTNIAINAKSLVYTSTPNTDEALKKLDVNGDSILSMVNYDSDQDVVDLTVTDAGYLYAVYDDGLIVEYDPQGNLLFAFDVTDSVSDLVGQVKNPVGIAVDGEDRVFVLDGTANAVVAYAPTDFAALVHSAVGLYNDGEYRESTEMFESILTQNANFALAHAALGKAYYQNGDYASALKEFRLANDVAGYSETYWKIRDVWLKANLSWIFLVLIALVFVSAVLKRIGRKTEAFAGIRTRVSSVLPRPEVRKYTLAFHVMKHPADTYFQIKRLRRATPASATVLLGILFVEYLLVLRYTGYVFNTFSDSVNLFGEAAKFFGAVLLFVFSNYLISTLSDGEGWLRDVYVGTVYSLSPLLLGWIPLLFLSRVLTQNEAVVYQICSAVLYGWTAVLLFLSTKEIHNYEIGETVKNLLMTLFTMVIIILMGFIVYVFGSQLWNFLVSWWKEVINRVFG